MQFLTDFADQAVVLPLIVAIAAMLGLQGRWRGAIAWLVATGGAFGLMLALKLIFLGCGGTLGLTRIASPSGHAASAALVCGGLVACFIGSVPRVLIGALIGAVVIGATRVGLGVHTLEEVIIGGLVGSAGAMALARVAGEPPRPRIWPLALVMLVIVGALHGNRLPAENTIRHVSSLIRLILPWCEPALVIQRANAAPARVDP